MKKQILLGSLYFILGILINSNLSIAQQQIPHEGTLYVDPHCNNNCIENQNEIQNALTKLKIDCGLKVNVIFNSFDCDLAEFPNGESNVYGPNMSLPNGTISGFWYKHKKKETDDGTDYLIVVSNNCNRICGKNSSQIHAIIENLGKINDKKYSVNNSCRIKKYLEEIRKYHSCNVDLGISTPCDDTYNIKNEDLPKYFNLNGSKMIENNSDWNNLIRKEMMAIYNMRVAGIEEYPLLTSLADREQYYQNINSKLNNHFYESLVLWKQSDMKFKAIKISNSQNPIHYGVHYLGSVNLGAIQAGMIQSKSFSGGFSVLNDIFAVTCEQKSFLQPYYGTCNFNYGSTENSFTYEVVGSINGMIGKSDLNDLGGIKIENVNNSPNKNFWDILAGNDPNKTGADAQSSVEKNSSGKLISGIIDFSGLVLSDFQNAINASKEYSPNSSCLFIITHENNENAPSNDAKMSIVEVADKLVNSIDMESEDSPSVLYRIHIKKNGSFVINTYFNKNDEDKLKNDPNFNGLVQAKLEELISLSNTESNLIGEVEQGQGWKNYKYGVSGEMNMFRKYGVFGEITKSVWDDQILPNKMWKTSEGYSIKIIPAMAGTVDGFLGEVLGIFSILKLAYSTIASDEDKKINLDSFKVIDVMAGMLPSFNFDSNAGSDVLWHANSKAVVEAIFMVAIPGNKSLDLVTNIVKKSGLKKGISRMAGSLKIIEYQKLATEAFKTKMKGWSTEIVNKYFKHLNRLNEGALAERYIKRIIAYPEIADLITKHFDIEEVTVNGSELKSIFKYNGIEVDVAKVVSAFPEVNDAFYKTVGNKIGFIDKLSDLDQNDFVQFFKDISDNVPEAKLLEWGAEFGRSPKNLDTWKVLKVHGDPAAIDARLLSNATEHFETYPYLKDQLKDIDLFKGYKEFADDIELSWEILDGIEGNISEIVSSKAGNKDFWKWLRYGKKFEQDVVLNGLKDRTSQIHKDLKQKVKNEFGNSIDLDDYDMYSQVQLKIDPVTLPSGRVVDYFVADQVYVKWGKDAYGIDVVQDFIVIENKLKSGTSLTTPQNKGKAATSFDVRSVQPKFELQAKNKTYPKLNKNTLIPVNSKWVKIYDSDEGKIVSGMDKIK